MKKSWFVPVFMVFILISCTGTGSFPIGARSQKPVVTMKVVKYGNNGQETEVRENDVLTRADRYAVRLAAQNSAYVYVFNIDSGKNIIPLFPNRRYSLKNNFLTANQCLRVPDNQDKWLRLDKNTGVEKIILLASKKTLSDRACEQILNAFRGCGGLGDPPCDPSYSDDITILKINFNHR